MDYPGGSVWRKWDLHVHSPSSKLSNGYPRKSGEPDWDMFIDELEKLKDVSVLGITDYFSVEGYKKINEYISKGRLSNIDLILPNIEFRLEDKNKDNEHINLHVILSEESASDTVKLDNFLGNIELLNVTKDGSTRTCKPGDLDEVGYDKALVRLDNIKQALIKTFGDKNKPYLLVGVANGYGGIRPPQSDQGRRSEYAKLIDENVDIFFGRSGDREFFLDESAERYAGSKPKAVIQGSDTRSLEGICAWIGKEAEVGSGKTKETKEITWIKADPGFEGLKKAICEPADRFFIGKEPQKISQVALNKSKYIKSIKISTPQGGSRWFNSDILINPGLTAIIGKKGSGKSALSDIIAHTAGTKIQKEYFSFLHDNRFLRDKQRASLYQSELTWQDGTKINKSLTDSSYDGINERVKYLPQSYVEAICDPFGMTQEFQKEVNDVIFSYVKQEDRLGTSSLGELIETRSRVINKNIISKRVEVSSINDGIVKLEEKTKKSYIEKLDKLLFQKKQELKNLETPKNIAKPKNTLPKLEQEKAAKIQKNIDEIRVKIENFENELEEVNKKLIAIDNINRELNLTQEIVDKSLDSISHDLIAIGLTSKQVASFKIDKRAVNKIERQYKTKKLLIKKILGSYDGNRVEGDLVDQKSKLEKDLAKVFSKLDLKNKSYQEFLVKSEQYNKQKLEIDGSSTDGTINTIKSIESEIDYVRKDLNKQLQKLYEERIRISKELYGVISSKSDFYSELYKPVIEKLEDEKKRQKESESILTFTVGTMFDKEKFSNDFLSSIHQGRRGSFQGNEKGRKLLKQLMDKGDLRTKKGTLAFIDEIIQHLSVDSQSTEKDKPKVEIEDQLLGSKLDLYNLLYRLPFIDVKYSILFNGKDLNENEFSPGEKGALLLVFYLLVDKDNTPLIIDQPEENLDNESVFHLLVPYVKSAKNNRQVIIVTHNPNLAVVCDAEQIIRAEMDKRKEQIRYYSGSIENEAMNKKISDILEGTLLAFDVRNTKYSRNN